MCNKNPKEIQLFEKVYSEYFWYDEMAVGNGFEDFLAEPFISRYSVLNVSQLWGG